MDIINRLLNRPSSSSRSQSRPSTPESGNDSPLPKTAEHEVKVRFAREFADVGSVTYSGPESLSSASSFHSLSSTLSTKSSSGICPDDTLPSVTVSQENVDYSSVPTVSNLSSPAGSEAGEIVFSDSNAVLQTDIGLNPSPRSLSPIVNVSHERLSLDESVLNDFILEERSADLKNEKSVKAQEPLPPDVLNLTDDLLQSLTNRLGGIRLDSEALTDEELEVKKNVPVEEEHFSVGEHFHVEEHVSVDELSPVKEHRSVHEHFPVQERFPAQEHFPVHEHLPVQEYSPVQEQSHVQEHSFVPEDPSVQEHHPAQQHPPIEETCKVTSDRTEEHVPCFQAIDVNHSNSAPGFIEKEPAPHTEQIPDLEVILNDHRADLLEKSESVGTVEKENVPLTTVTLDETITLDDASINSALTEEDQYTKFEPSLPQENNIASTAVIVSNDQQTFEEFQLAAEGIANDIFKTSLELTEEATRFPDIPSEPVISECDINELFQDPECFDFLLARGNSRNPERLRAESLYVKFDPLISNTSMLPQGNSQPISEEQNGKIEPTLVNSGTPKHNPAIAAIDRLLFYSPLPAGGTECNTEKIQEKKEQPVQESKPDTAPSVDINVSKELELVRATVLQLEEELQKQKSEYEEELERQKSGYQEKVNKLQVQLAQEVKNKNQMTVVVEEYEKSISRLVAERERDRTSLEQEKTKLQEELQAANHHLSNTEAAFNDVHQKYERIKGVVWAYKSNETVLKESIQENLETIKDLEARYDQLKNHAMNQLEKANSDLDVIRKQHDTERLKLHAMVRKAELKSNTLAGLVEQVTKENKELMQILDEVIARVGRPTVD